MVNDLRSALRVAQEWQRQPTAVILDGRTLQSTCESGLRAGYDDHVYDSANLQRKHEERGDVLPGALPGLHEGRVFDARPWVKLHPEWITACGKLFSRLGEVIAMQSNTSIPAVTPSTRASN